MRVSPRSVELELTRCEGNWKPTRFGNENCLKALCGFESRHLEVTISNSFLVAVTGNIMKIMANNLINSSLFV